VFESREMNMAGSLGEIRKDGDSVADVRVTDKDVNIEKLPMKSREGEAKFGLKGGVFRSVLSGPKGVVKNRHEGWRERFKGLGAELSFPGGLSGPFMGFK
jgi:hypothetical protein